jgi:hypothetical protein
VVLEFELRACNFSVGGKNLSKHNTKGRNYRVKIDELDQLKNANSCIKNKSN